MRTQNELRAFVWGILAGLVIIVATFAIISQIADVKWKPVKGADWRQMEADKHYGCTRAQQAPNGECE